MTRDAGDGSDPMRKIAITFEESGVGATAVLQEEHAPRTCEAMWQMLSLAHRDDGHPCRMGRP